MRFLKQFNYLLPKEDGENFLRRKCPKYLKLVTRHIRKIAQNSWIWLIFITFHHFQEEYDKMNVIRRVIGTSMSPFIRQPVNQSFMTLGVGGFYNLGLGKLTQTILGR